MLPQSGRIGHPVIHTESELFTESVDIRTHFIREW